MAACNRLVLLFRPSMYYERPLPFPHANLLMWWWELRSGHVAYCDCPRRRPKGKVG